AIDTAAPSPMSHEILNSNPYTYLDDAPLEERRARAVALRRTDPDLAAGLGALDPAAIAEVRAQAWPDVRDADELHDALLSMVLVPAAEIEAAGWGGFAAELAAAGRATWGESGALRALVAVERLPVARAAVPGLRADLDWPGAEPGREEALHALLGGWLECVGPPPPEGPARASGAWPGGAGTGPPDLDGLCLAGAVAWGRLETDPPPEEDAGPRRAKAPTRAAPLAFVLREDLAWLLAPTQGVCDLPSAARAVLAHLERHGASFLADIARGAGLLPAAAEEALWTLVARGLVTGDGTAGLRTLLKPDAERRPRRLRAVCGGGWKRRRPWSWPPRTRSTWSGSWCPARASRPWRTR